MTYRLDEDPESGSPEAGATVSPMTEDEAFEAWKAQFKEDVQIKESALDLYAGTPVGSVLVGIMSDVMAPHLVDEVTNLDGFDHEEHDYEVD